MASLYTFNLISSLLGHFFVLIINTHERLKLPGRLELGSPESRPQLRPANHEVLANFVFISVM